VLCRPAAFHSGSSEQKASEIGFAKENAAGIPLDAAERNYKDPNHKPELVFALTPFLAMNAFREFSEIISLLQPVAGANKAIAHFLKTRTRKAEPTVCQPA
jgi:mannose-6-phosphate isomerase